ncbi:MAG: sigma-70 family RNA polymerase sigma factor [Bacteroidales bacterium]|nr:sigma-70 family RNA polymerase sigma factor [Bacteroidales bacterium]
MIKIDKSILFALQKGSHPAFEKVFVFYFMKIKTFIFAYVKTMTDAEELAEEIFVELWQNHEIINPEKSFDSYLYTIAKNKAINFLKRKYRSERIDETQTHLSFSHSPEEEYLALEKALLIEMIVEKMPAQRKKIYQLRQQDLTNDEIARELETTKRNVESQISLAFKEIRNGIQYLIIFVV